MKKKLLSILLSLAMVITMMPAMTFTAYAETCEHTFVDGKCTQCGKDDHDHSHNDWTNWGDEASEQTSLPTTTGNYYLTHDVELSNENRIINKNVVNICLNGHVIKQTGDYCVWRISSGTLNLYDCGTEEHYFTVGDDGLWTLTGTKSGNTKTVSGGVITGGKGYELVENSSGGAINMDNNNGVFNMYGGNIAGNSTHGANHMGGAVEINNNNTFTMYGGAICGNVSKSGGAICSQSSGSVTIEGGVISENTSTGSNGYGAVFVSNDSATFTMNGGVIRDNKVENGSGGGVYMSSGNFVMTGGEISGNSGMYAGGIGISTYVSSIKISGGKIFGNNAAHSNGAGGVSNNGGKPIYLGGTAQIFGNTNNGNPSNLKLVTSHDLFGRSGSNIIADPEPGFYVGVTYGGSPGAFMKNATADDVNYFFADDVAKYVKHNSGDNTLSIESIPSGSKKITVVPSNGGVVNAPQYAAANSEVILTVKADKGYKLKSLSVKDADGGNVDVTENKFTMPDNAVTVTAEFEEGAEAHTHKIGSADVDFTPWESATSLPTTSGNYYLTKDVTLDGTWTVPNDTEINLCLKGHVIKQTKASNSVITVKGTLNLFDCDTTTVHDGYIDSTTHLWTVDASNEHNSSDDQYDITGGIITGVYRGVINNGTFTMNGGTIAGNNTNDSSGGGVRNASNGFSFTLNGGKIVGNYASSYGGGVAADGFEGEIVINGGEISKNTSGKAGGGVQAVKADGNPSVEIHGGKISGNTSLSEIGGGVMLNCSDFVMDGGEISDNTANGNGGGMYLVTQSDVSISNCLISGNTATGDGGGIYLGGNNKLTLGGTASISKNTAANSGGGVYAFSTFTMESGTIEKNEANSTTTTDGGGGVYVCSNKTFTMKGGTISDNTAKNSGGGVNNHGTFIMEGGTIKANKSNSAVTSATAGGGGGGAYVCNNSTFTMKDGTISGNEANYGGGVYVHNTATGFMMDGGKISGNTAKSNGGGVLYGGSNSDGKIIVGGTARVFDNKKAENAASNINPNTKKIALGTGADGNNVAEPTDGMLIGVDKTTGLFTTSGTANYVKYFTPDKSNFYVCYESDALKLSQGNATKRVVAVVPSANGIVYTDTQMVQNTEEIVTLTVVPDEGYELAENGLVVSYTDDGEKTCTLEPGGNNTYTFKMPAFKVTVTAEFEKSGPKIKVTKHKEGDEEVANPVYGTAEGGARELFDISTTGFGTEPTLKLQWKHVDEEGAETWDGAPKEGDPVLTIDEKVIKVTTGANTPAGSYIFRVTNGQPKTIDSPAEGTPNPNFVASKEIDLVVEKAPIEPVVTIEGWTYGDTAKIPSVEGNTGNGDVSYDYKVQNAGDGTYVATPPTDAGSYTVRATIAAKGNYAAGIATKNFIISKATPTVDMLKYTKPDSLTYDGNNKVATIVPTQEFVGLGEITVKYKKGSTLVTDTKDVGDYIVVAEIAEGDNYTLADGLTSDGWKFTITKADYEGVEKTASANLKEKVGSTATITLPEINTGASYGIPVKNKDNDPYSLGDISGQTIIATSTEGTAFGDMTFTVPVVPDDNHNGYDIIVTITKVKHTHSFTYTEDGYKLTATCTDDCVDDYNTKPLTLTLTAPSDLVYDASAKTVGFADAEETAWTTAGLVIPAISYVAKTGYSLTGDKAVNAGDYTASVSAGEATATLDFSISPAPLTMDMTAVTITKPYDNTVAATVPHGALIGVKQDDISNGVSVAEESVAGTYADANVGTGKSITLKEDFTLIGEAAGNYRLTPPTGITGSVTAKNVAESRGEVTEDVAYGVGTFTVPVFYDDDLSQYITGTLTYTYAGATKTKTEIETALKALGDGATGTISWSFEASGNYTGTITGTIKFTIVEKSEPGPGPGPGPGPTPGPTPTPSDDSDDAKVVVAEETATVDVADKSEAVLTTRKFKQLVNNDKIEQVIIKTNTAEFTFDKKAITEIAAQSGNSTLVKVAAIWQEEESVKSALDVYELKVVAVSGNNEIIIGDFKGGKVTVRVAIPEGLRGKKLGCLYKNDKGVYSRKTITKQDNEKGYFDFTTTHFSSYVVAEASVAQKLLVNQTAVTQNKLKASKGGKVKISFKRATWDKELGKKVTTYQIYRATKKSGKYKKVATVTNKKSSKTITYTNKKLKKGTKYYYKVRGRVKLSNGKYAYTKWSKIKSVKAK